MIDVDALVVGGGISGLVIARGLAEAGLGVELWERGTGVGGKIATGKVRGYQLERAASMLVNFRAEVNGFVDAAGLGERRCPRTPGCARYLLDGSRLRAVPVGPRALLGSSFLGPAARLRMLSEPFAARGAPDETVAAFITRRFGREFLERAFEPYVGGPLASDVDRAEARATVPRLKALEARYGSLVLGALCRRAWRRGGGARPDVFSFPGGMAELTESLARPGGFALRRECRLSALAPVAGGWRAHGTTGGAGLTVCARQLVLSTPSDVAAGLLADLDPELANLLNGIDYAPVSVVHTGFSRDEVAHPLDGSGFLVPRANGHPATGCLWPSSVFPGRAPPGEVLLSTYLGGARHPEVADWSDARRLDAVLALITPLLGVGGVPRLVRVEHHARALPLYHGPHTARVQAIDRRLAHWPGLHLEANWRDGVSVRDRIVCGQRAVRAIAAQATGSARRAAPAAGGIAGVTAGGR